MKVVEINNCKLMLDDSNNAITSLIVNEDEYKSLFIDFLSDLEHKDVDELFFNGHGNSSINSYLNKFLSFLNI